MSMVGGSDSKHSLAMRLALPVPLSAKVFTIFWNWAKTGAEASTSDKGASAGKPLKARTAGVGKIMAPTSFMFRPVSTAS